MPVLDNEIAYFPQKFSVPAQQEHGVHLPSCPSVYECFPNYLLHEVLLSFLTTLLEGLEKVSPRSFLYQESDYFEGESINVKF